MTAGTTRNGTRKFGTFRRGHNKYVVLADDDTATYAGDAYAGDASYGFDESATQGFEMPAPQAFEEPTGQDRSAGRYTGRHANRQGKTTRKRVGRIVPVAAVAATIAAGTTAAYVLGSGGHPQPAHLNAAMSSLSGSLASTQAVSADSAAPGLIKVATASGSSAAQAAAKAAAKATPSRKPAATPTAAATHAAAPSTPVATQAAARVVTHSASASASTQSASTLSCNLSYGMLPDNVTAIVSFLLANGYSDNAAAGIAGNMYQESKGNPESVGMGGGGLIGFTPLPAGYVTGNVTADLQTQLKAVLTYNQGWSQYISELNAAASPADAASIYVTDFERAGIPAASTREASATNVASACGI